MHRRRRRGQGARDPPPKKKNREKIFFGQLLCKIRAFFGQNRVKFGYFDNFSGKEDVKFGHFDNFSSYFSGKNVVPPKVD